MRLKFHRHMLWHEGFMRKMFTNKHVLKLLFSGYINPNHFLSMNNGETRLWHLTSSVTPIHFLFLPLCRGLCFSSFLCYFSHYFLFPFLPLWELKEMQKNSLPATAPQSPAISPEKFLTGYQVPDVGLITGCDFPSSSPHVKNIFQYIFISTQPCTKTRKGNLCRQEASTVPTQQRQKEAHTVSASLPHIPTMDKSRASQTLGAEDGGHQPRWGGGLGVQNKLPIQGWQKTAHMWLGLEHGFHMFWKPGVLLLPDPRLKPQEDDLTRQPHIPHKKGKDHPKKTSSMKDRQQAPIRTNIQLKEVCPYLQGGKGGNGSIKQEWIVTEITNE